MTPFYVFQVFSILLWSAAESYYYYSACIFLMSVVSLIAQIVQERMMERALKKTVNNISTCLVARPGREGVMFEETSSINLVPGDVIQIPSSGCIMQCDAVLNSGTAIVNESMLTGESVPITKTSVLDNELVFNEKDHNRNILYCGTCVIQTRTVNMQPVTAMVIRTGFLTTKGSLICSILYPKSMDFKFTKDSYKYVAALSCVAVVGMVYTACCMALNGSVAEDVIIRMLDIVTIVVPPALPAALTYSIAIAQYRLKRNSIFCLNSKSINVCGSLDAFCFDKTGTLTEDGLDIYCIQPCGSPGNDVISSNSDSGIPLSSYYLDHIRINMASCHSLVCLDGIFCGDPIDLKMFEYTQWHFIEYEDATMTDLKTPIVVKPKLENQEKMIPEYGVLKQMPFSSKLQRMSVIVRSQQRPADSFDPLNTFSVYAKGSPETISSLSIAHTGWQKMLIQVLVHYTRQGFRVLALAWKPLYSDVPTSDQIESSLIFLGLIVMENKLKKETISTIKKLKNADLKIVMVTGDNLLTALNIAQKCFFIERNESVYFISLDTPNNSVDIPLLSFCQINEFEDDHFLGVSSSESNLKEAEVKQTKYHFAITGKMWKLFRSHYPDLVSKLVVRGTIFARFSPDQKKQLVEELQAVGYYVGMCGDGANDCGALKTAHSGISLSETEASVASPFTSKQANISCVVRLVREGRCALATSFGIFKFMTAYSMNQFLIACIFIWNLTLLSDMQFMYQDIFMLTPLSFTFCFTSSYKVLVARKPMISLVAFTPLLSIVTNLALNLATMIFMYYFTKNQTWLVKVQF
uniref:P-type ATPase A domain-containing protein n=1 Tax=Helobdella robusta TaxID=6412 RepID=T1G367_HELRO